MCTHLLWDQHREPQLGHHLWWAQAGSWEQSWGSQRDGMMQNHVPWVQKGAINGEKGWGGGERWSTMALICWQS